MYIILDASASLLQTCGTLQQMNSVVSGELEIKMQFCIRGRNVAFRRQDSRKILSIDTRHQGFFKSHLAELLSYFEAMRTKLCHSN